MKKKIVGVIAVVAIAAMAGYNVYSSQNDGKLSDLALANVEALASGESDYDSKIWERYYRPEGDGYNCTKGGSETC